MLVHPQIDPIALQVGPLAIHWYGLMYLLAFAQFVLLGRFRIRHHEMLSQFDSRSAAGEHRVRRTREWIGARFRSRGYAVKTIASV